MSRLRVPAAKTVLIIKIRDRQEMKVNISPRQLLLNRYSTAITLWSKLKEKE